MARDQDAAPLDTNEALEHLGRLSLRDLSMESLLGTVAGLVRGVMPADSQVSVTLLVQQRPATVATTGPLAAGLDETQYEYGGGPCLHAARTGVLTEIPDTRAETRWPDYARVAAGRGNLSSLSIPLRIDEEEQVAGALNVYARHPEAFDESSREAATRFGPYAAVAAGNLHAYRSARDLADNLQVALESRAVIDQAKGMLIERYQLTPDRAFQLLAEASMAANRKVRDVADHLVLTGELPAPAPRRRPGRRPRSARGHSDPGAPGRS